MRRIQSQIAFGDHGHAAIVDPTGRIIAHPFGSWVESSHDLSALPIVQAMTHGGTGVAEFYSPAMNGMMIAGYTVVLETGWGVMVPQPLVEFRQRADQIHALATIVALAAFARVALVSWVLAKYLARPVRQVAATAEAVFDGNENVEVPALHGLMPREIRQLCMAFSTMLDGLRWRTPASAFRHRSSRSSSRCSSRPTARLRAAMAVPAWVCRSPANLAT